MTSAQDSDTLPAIVQHRRRPDDGKEKTVFRQADGRRRLISQIAATEAVDKRHGGEHGEGILRRWDGFRRHAEAQRELGQRPAEGRREGGGHDSRHGLRAGARRAFAVDRQAARGPHEGAAGDVRQPGDLTQDAKKDALRPRRSDYWCLPSRADADFVAHMEDVLDVYERPYDPSRPVVCMDEKPCRLLGEARESWAMRPGDDSKVDSEHVRNGTCSIFAFVEPLGGRHHVCALRRRTAGDWARQIKCLVDVMYPDAERITLVMDNLNTHVPSPLYKTFAPQEANRPNTVTGYISPKPTIVKAATSPPETRKAFLTEDITIVATKQSKISLPHKQPCNAFTANPYHISRRYRNDRKALLNSTHFHPSL